MSRSQAAQAASEIRRQRKRSGKTNSTPADAVAVKSRHLKTKIGFGASEAWTASEFPDGSLLLRNDDTGWIRVPVSRRHRDLAAAALGKDTER